MYFILGMLIGFILGILGTLLVTISKEKDKVAKEEEKKSVYIRRGIWTNEYSSGIGTERKKFEVQYELGELEATATKSKVEIISSAASKSAFNDDSTKNTLSKMVNHTWILSSEIEWIEDTARVRNDKIDQLLGK
jgi:hypothetical protein